MPSRPEESKVSLPTIQDSQFVLFSLCYILKLIWGDGLVQVIRDEKWKSDPASLVLCIPLGSCDLIKVGQVGHVIRSSYQILELTMAGKYHGVILLPEGLIESIPEFYALLQVIFPQLNSSTSANFEISKLWWLAGNWRIIFLRTEWTAFDCMIGFCMNEVGQKAGLCGTC